MLRIGVVGRILLGTAYGEALANCLYLPLSMSCRVKAFSETQLPLQLSAEYTLLRRRIVSEPVIRTLSHTPAEAKPPITSLK